MRYHALACDYDGTLARGGHVDEATLAALERLLGSGRRLILVTGRELDDLARIFPHLDLFDCVVAENGAVLYLPATKKQKLLAEAPPAKFVDALRARDLAPLSLGQVIVATWEPNQTAVLETIRALGLELHVIFNKGAVMVLPSGVNKATGLAAALETIELSCHNVVGIGDAENDHAFLSACECSAAVANALPTLKERVDIVTERDHGAGVEELVVQMLSTDLRDLEDRLARHEIVLGEAHDDDPLRLKPYGSTVLVAGTSGSGKSTFAAGVLEQLAEHRYQYCIIDPEGDFTHIAGAVVLGAPDNPPVVDAITALLRRPDQNAVVNLLGIKLEDRPTFFAAMLPRLQELRARSGRPHWIVVDEAHHLLPSSWDPATITMPQEMHGVMLITVHPDHVARPVLAAVDTIVALGNAPAETIALFAQTLGMSPPAMPSGRLGHGEVIAWNPAAGAPRVFRSRPPRAERQRHLRKYAHGELGEDKSFFFRGPQGKLNLRAQNLSLFMQLAEGVDDQTWLYHLRRGDYSRWLREAIKDEDLAGEVEGVENQPDASASSSREQIAAAIKTRYTAPA